MRSNVSAYLPYPKQFTPYKWYKPLLTALLHGLIHRIHRFCEEKARLVQ